MKPEDLLYSAHVRCPCGAGMAYPTYRPGSGEELARDWTCSALLRGEVELVAAATDEQRSAAKIGQLAGAGVDASGQVHIRLGFAFFDVKSEGQPSAGGATTRPESDPSAKELASASAAARDRREAWAREILTRSSVGRAAEGDERDLSLKLAEVFACQGTGLDSPQGAVGKAIATALRHNPPAWDVARSLLGSLDAAAELPPKACETCSKPVGREEPHAGQGYRLYHSACAPW